MPKSTERTWDPQQRKYIERTVGRDEDVVDKAKAQDASRLGSRVKPIGAGVFVPPKMNPGEDSSSYSARVAAARRKWEASRQAGILENK